MDKETKKELLKMQMLMERMDKHYTREESILKEKRMINETIGPDRVQVNRDKMLDILDKMDENSRGYWTSFTYVKPLSFYKTKKNWKSDEMSAALANHSDMADSEWHKGLSDFNREDTQLKKNPINAIVVAQKYLVHWTSPEKYKEAYGQYNQDLHNLRMKFGADASNDATLGDNHNQREKIGDIAQVNQTGKLSRDMNMVGSSVKTTNYIIGEDGHIIGEIPGDIVKAMSTPKKSYDIETAMAEILKDNPEKIAEYKAEKAKLDATFRAQNFLLDRILTIVATAGDTKYYFINDNIITEIAAKSDVMVNPSDFKEIAEKELSTSFKDIDSEDFSN